MLVSDVEVCVLNELTRGCQFETCRDLLHDWAGLT